MHFYPNPFKNVVHLNHTAEGDFTLVISGMDGKMIYLHTYPASQAKFDLSDIPAGPYIFKIISSGKTYEEKMIKIS